MLGSTFPASADHKKKTKDAQDFKPLCLYSKIHRSFKRSTKKERMRMCKIYFRNLSWVWGVDRKIQACRVMQDYDLEGRIFRSTCHTRKILFLAYFVSYLKSNPFDCWHLPYFDNISVMLNDIINFSDVNLNDGVPLFLYNQCTSKAWEISIFILPWITFHFLYVSIIMRFFSTCI